MSTSCCLRPGFRTYEIQYANVIHITWMPTEFTIEQFSLVRVFLTWGPAPVADPDQAFGGGSQIGRRQKSLHLLKYQRLSATIVVSHIL